MKDISCYFNEFNITLPFGVKQRRMLRNIERFGKHYSCYLHGECVVVWPYIVLAVDDTFNNYEELRIRLEDGNSNVCRNVG